MKFKFLTGDVNWQDYGGKWISPKLNNGEFDYWIVMEFTNMDEACGRDNEGQDPYHISLSAVSPAQAGQEGLKKAFDCCGINEGDELTNNPLVQVECLHFGFYMDGPKNRIGTTGWEAIKGDTMAPLRRMAQ